MLRALSNQAMPKGKIDKNNNTLIIIILLRFIPIIIIGIRILAHVYFC